MIEKLIKTNQFNAIAHAFQCIICLFIRLFFRKADTLLSNIQ